MSVAHQNVRLVYNANENFNEVKNFTQIAKRSGCCILFSDITALLLSFVCGGLGAWLIATQGLHKPFQELLSLDTLMQFIIFTGLGGIALLWLESRGHYRQRLPYWEVMEQILTVAFVGFLVCGFGQFMAKQSFSRLWLGLSWALFALFLFSGRIIVRNYLKRQGKWQIPALLVGEGASALSAKNALRRERHMGFTILKHISPKQLAHLNQPNAWIGLMQQAGASHLFLALEGSEMERYQPALKSLVRERVPFTVVPPWMDLPTGTMSPHHFLMHDVLMLHDTNRLHMPVLCHLKRGFDLVCSSLALILLAPLCIPVALIIRMDGGPAIFKQERVGKNGKRFGCYKFRSMCVNAEDILKQHLAENPEAAAEWNKFQKLKNDVRITRIGHFIRRTSIDELPQLLNVWKGDMSFVGPRPIMPDQEKLYGDDFIYYESVRPGITGPWQVSGRNQLTFAERVKLECYYAKN